MRKIFTLIFVLFLLLSTNAQEKAEIKKDTLFDKWSLEFNAGINKAIRPFTEGYYQDFDGIRHFDIGARYMFNALVGAKLDFAYDNIKNKNNTGSLPFENNVYRINLQGVFNLGKLFTFSTFSSRVGLLAHAGFQASLNNYIDNIDVVLGPGPEPPPSNPLFDTSKWYGGFIVGLTPQFRISNTIAITADVSFINNINQNLNWDGKGYAEKNNFSGQLFTSSIGLTFYLGKHEKHADWFVTQVPKEKEKADLNRLEELERKVNENENERVKADNEIKAIILSNKTNKIDINLLKEFVENGFINIFYDVNKDSPNVGSTNDIFILVKYFKEFPNAKATLIGYADERGNSEFNMNLSIRRAQNVKNILAANGIDTSNIAVQGLGEDTNYNSKTVIEYDLSRRVSISIEK